MTMMIMKRFLHILLLLLIAFGAEAQTLTLRDPAFVARLNSSGGSLTLDKNVGTAQAAWSWSRKLRSAWTGSLIRVRRSSDDAEQNISADADNRTDQSAMTAFAAGSDLYLVTMYDQTGNGHDLTQSTAANQPKIATAGVILTGSNGRVRGDFSGGTSIRLVNTSINITQPDTIVSVFRVNTWTSNRRVWDGTTSVEEGRQNLYLSASSPDIRLGTAGTSGIINSTLTLGTWGIVRAYLNGASSELQVNNGTATTGNAGSIKLRGFTMGATEAGGSGADCDFHEVIIFASDLTTTQRNTLLTDINDFYQIYTP